MSESADPVADFARLRAAFHAALDAPPAERAALLAQLQQSDPALAAELSALLADAESEAAPTDAPPSIDGYTLETPLGRGATGEVWRARQQLAGTCRTVALKLLHPGRSALALQRFRREWRVLARLDHPGIARPLDAGIAGTRAWLALEYVDGPGYAEQLPTLPLARRVEVLAEVCAAVAHAHARLVLHRDLKPANLRFGADGRIRCLRPAAGPRRVDGRRSGPRRTLVAASRRRPRIRPLRNRPAPADGAGSRSRRRAGRLCRGAGSGGRAGAGGHSAGSAASRGGGGGGTSGGVSLRARELRDLSARVVFSVCWFRHDVGCRTRVA